MRNESWYAEEIILSLWLQPQERKREAGEVRSTRTYCTFQQELFYFVLFYNIKCNYNFFLSTKCHFELIKKSNRWQIAVFSERSNATRCAVTGKYSCGVVTVTPLHVQQHHSNITLQTCYPLANKTRRYAM